MPQVVIHWSSKPIEFVGRVGMIQISSSFAGAKNNPHVWHLLAEWLWLRTGGVPFLVPSNLLGFVFELRVFVCLFVCLLVCWIMSHADVNACSF